MTAPTMLAATARRYGPPDVVQIESMPRPLPKKGEILIYIAAAPVTTGEARIRALDTPAGFALLTRLVFGLRAPRWPVLGMEFAGKIVAVGAGVHDWAVGDRVFGLSGIKGGSHAQYIALPATGPILPTPDTLTDAEAASFFFGGLTAMDFLIRKGGLQPGERVLVNGASGAVGSAAVQIARHVGADVTATCSGDNLDFVRYIGAHHAVDYRRTTPEGPFDVILDVAGTLPYARACLMLAQGGRLLAVTATLWQMIGYGLRQHRPGHRVMSGTIAETPAAMRALLALHHADGYHPIIGATFPFDQISAAHALAGSHHKRGNCVVVMP